MIGLVMIRTRYKLPIFYLLSLNVTLSFDIVSLLLLTTRLLIMVNSSTKSNTTLNCDVIFRTKYPTDAHTDVPLRG